MLLVKLAARRVQRLHDVLPMPALLLCLASLLWPGSAGALEPGDLAPDFSLQTVDSRDGVESYTLWGESEVTALVIWSRRCPHCTEVALGIDALADSLRPLGMEVAAILFGPDDPVSLTSLLHSEGVTQVHWWDEDGSVARAYGLGARNLGAFLIDRSGVVREIFDDEMERLTDSLLPAARRLGRPSARGLSSSSPAAGSSTAAGTTTANPTDTPREAGRGADPTDTTREPARGGEARGPRDLGWAIDGRMKAQTSDGVGPDDVGVLGENLTPGSFFVWRWDLRATWRASHGIEIIPWLRASNETEEDLTAGADQLSSRYGSITVRWRRGRWAAAAGAQAFHLNPLLLQRWDFENAPPLGGGGCGCGSGTGALSQRSLEILGPDYTFEGLHLRFSDRWIRAEAHGAVPTWESEEGTGRYRTNLWAGLIEMGEAGRRSSGSDLPYPIGLRAAYVNVDDDRRTLELALPPEDRWESGLSVAAGFAPAAFVGGGALQGVGGLFLDGELGWLETETTGSAGLDSSLQHLSTFQRETAGRAWRLGGRTEWKLGELRLWGRAHAISLGRRYEPRYLALSYEADRRGWRVAGGLRAMDAGSPRERAAVSYFHRRLEEDTRPTFGRGRSTLQVVTLTVRPLADWVGDLHLVRQDDREGGSGSRERQQGGILEARLELGDVEPALRVETYEVETYDTMSRRNEERHYTQARFSLRVIL